MSESTPLRRIDYNGFYYWVPIGTEQERQLLQMKARDDWKEYYRATRTIARIEAGHTRANTLRHIAMRIEAYVHPLSERLSSYKLEMSRRNKLFKIPRTTRPRRKLP